MGKGTTVSRGTEVICPACNKPFIHPGRKRRWCSDECAKAMQTAGTVCSSRLRSVDRSIDQVCGHCGDPLGPMSVIGRKNLPGTRQHHAECIEAFKREVVGTCECGKDLRRRDSGICSACRRRDQTNRIRTSGEFDRCAAEYDEAGVLVRCESDAYPGQTRCSKHLNDWYRYKEYRPFVWKWDDIDEYIIQQKDVPAWRDRLLDEQGGRCGMFEICGMDISNNGTWHLDHDHGCKFHNVKRMCARCVRGTLCFGCNVQILGSLEQNGLDPLAVAREVMRYLESGDQLRLVVND